MKPHCVTIHWASSSGQEDFARLGEGTTRIPVQAFSGQPLVVRTSAVSRKKVSIYASKDIVIPPGYGQNIPVKYKPITSSA